MNCEKAFILGQQTRKMEHEKAAETSKGKAVCGICMVDGKMVVANGSSGMYTIGVDLGQK